VPLIGRRRRRVTSKQRCHSKDFEERGGSGQRENEKVREMEVRARGRAEKTEEREMPAKGLRLRDRMAATERRQKSGDVYLLFNNSPQDWRMHRRRREERCKREDREAALASVSVCCDNLVIPVP
jgi:hypothetical protein